VLTTADILRLATLPTARAIGLARIVGAQWPLSALGVGAPVGLARLLAEDRRHHSWHLLGWLCNLAGVGGSATSEDLQFQGGDDAPVVYTLLTNLVDAGSVTTELASARPSSTSQLWERASVGIESVVLRDCPDPLGRAAFWAALVTAPHGTPLDLDSLVIAAALSPVGEKADWESVLAAGFDRLRKQWFVDGGDGNELSLRPIGVLSGLRSLAERRMEECARELTHPAVATSADKQAIPREWSVHRYALSQDWAAYRSEILPGAGMEPAVEPDELIDAASQLSGSCDLAEVAGSLVALARHSFPAAEFIAEIPKHTVVAVPERLVLTVLYELLENALEATDRAGKIFLSVRANDADVIIDVFDDGHGLDPAIMRAAQVFRPGFSTRGEVRGTGMHLARRLTDVVRGELEVADRSDGHPVFKGAHFTLILPGTS
jgi:anti-sigma regulatory factor (Ser/Thr protein kinase)